MSKEDRSRISRRNFIKGSAGVTALGVLGACAPKVINSDSGSTALDTTAAPAYVPADSSIEADVVVVGLGTTGILAAVAAADKGAKVIAVEKAQNLASTNVGNLNGIMGIESTEQKKYDGYLTQKEAFLYMLEGPHFQTNAKVLRNICAKSGKAMDIMIDGGIKFDYEFATDDPSSLSMLQRGGHVFIDYGTPRTDGFQSILDSRNVECLYDSPATMLIVEDSIITGVQCSTDDGILDVKAKSVVLSTGGFMANIDMVMEHFAGARIMRIGPNTNQGDGIKMAQAAGGQLGKNFSISLNDFGGANEKASTRSAYFPGSDFNVVFQLPVCGCLLVDSQGSRFFDEGQMCENTMYVGEPAIRDSKYYGIVDQAYLDQLSSVPVLEFLGEAATTNMAPAIRAGFDGIVLDNIFDDFDEAIEEGWAFKADSIEELTQFIDMPNLVATIEEYNQYCEDGEDPQFYKKEDYLIPVNEGPFYIAEFQPSGWVTLGGMKTDGDCRVVDPANKPIPGLFAAGADADLWSVPYFQGGSAQGFCVASGFIAGEAAADFAQA